MSRCFLHFFQILIVGVNSGAKTQDGLKCQKIMSVQALHSWVSIHHMIVLFCCTSLKWWYPNAFLISSEFWFSGLLGWRGLKRQKMAQNDKKICITSYLRNFTSYDCGFWYTCVKWWYLQEKFFIFSKVWFFRFFKIYQ